VHLGEVVALQRPHPILRLGDDAGAGGVVVRLPEEDRGEELPHDLLRGDDDGSEDASMRGEPHVLDVVGRMQVGEVDGRLTFLERGNVLFRHPGCRDMAASPDTLPNSLHDFVEVHLGAGAGDLAAGPIGRYRLALLGPRGAVLGHDPGPRPVVPGPSHVRPIRCLISRGVRTSLRSTLRSPMTVVEVRCGTPGVPRVLPGS